MTITSATFPMPSGVSWTVNLSVGGRLYTISAVANRRSNAFFFTVLNNDKVVFGSKRIGIGDTIKTPSHPHLDSVGLAATPTATTTFPNYNEVYLYFTHLLEE